jgi:hypothetical protein
LLARCVLLSARAGDMRVSYLVGPGSRRSPGVRLATRPELARMSGAGESVPPVAAPLCSMAPFTPMRRRVCSGASLIAVSVGPWERICASPPRDFT